MNDLAAEYKVLGIDRIPFLEHQYVKFRQYFHKIPVYGSLVTVELDKSNEFVSINTSVGDPSNVDPLSSISPKKIIGTLAERLDVQESVVRMERDNI
ncbi:hypothetical protein NKJ46_25270 [Mesorhizobium sp. M0166]|uniref:hypothetical protein n=1 Tax=unclassified Mesorhizobium TaxID=325217 RepID=UPI00333B9EEB